MTQLSPSESQRLNAAVETEERKIEEAVLAILRLTQGIPGTLERFQEVQLRAIRRYCGRTTGDLGGGLIG
jgi:hypothetical protein